MNNEELEVEFERQLENLLSKDYPKLAGFGKDEFLKHISPLKEKLRGIDTAEVDLDKGHLPFVIVIKSNLVPADIAMSVVEKNGRKGITKLKPLIPEDFATLESVSLPQNDVYLLINIDRGKETLSVRPEDALITIQKSGRSPLTIDEGIAIVTQFPEFLMKNNCFSLLASRHKGDQRVPAIWINADKNPNLGWCWDRNPHTWLGSASCLKRI